MVAQYWDVTYARFGEERTVRIHATSRAGARVTVRELVGPGTEIIRVQAV